MALSQKKFREIVFQIVYSHDFAQNAQDDLVSFLMRHFEATKKTICMAQEKAADICQKFSELDHHIAAASSEYELHRIPGVEKNILRLGVYELCFAKDVPPQVVIAEAIRLSRKFATPEGAAFVNAILDAIYKKQPASC